MQACLGGTPHGFSVNCLRDNCFSFHVCNKRVGLFVNSIRDFTCKDFHVRFHLWGNGGPNWRREFDLWQKEEDNLWTVVTSKKNAHHPTSFVTRKSVSNQRNSRLLGKRQVDKPSVFKRLFLSNGDPFPVHQCSSSGTKIPPLLLQHDSNSVVSFHSPAISPVVAPSVITVVNDHLSPRIESSLNLNSGPARSVSSACKRCLAHGHSPSDCHNSIRCRKCFNYGHAARSCLARKTSKSSADILLEGAPSSPSVSPSSRPISSSEAQCPASPSCKTPLAIVLPSTMAHLHDVDFRLEMFQPQGTNIEAPWEGRTPRADFTLQGALPNSHQEFAAVVVDPQPQSI